jgi:hypothetical protein
MHPIDGELLRRRAADCRRAATRGRRGPNLYLIEMAERYEREAAALEHAGSKPQGAASTDKDGSVQF